MQQRQNRKYKMSKKLWGGRFKKPIDNDFEEFSKSIHYDYKLAKYDIDHSLIHTAVLKKAGILSKKEADELVSILKDIKKQIEQNKFKPGRNMEDIHTDIQAKVERENKKVALKLHSLRSRNDQVVFGEKGYCNNEAHSISKLLGATISSLSFLARKYKNVCIPAYTHTQRAQVIPFISYAEAFSAMLRRDKGRVDRFLENLYVFIGAGALAGSSLSKKDYSKEAKELLKGPSVVKVGALDNSLDNVSDRDFIIEFLSILSVIQMHLSRIAEDFILYSTKEFDFFDLPEEFCTGSSLMPHKKNPDFLELVRGGTGKVYGNLMSILTTMKGLPLTYNRDMQLDKEALFSSVETVSDELRIMAKFIKKVRLNKKRIEKTLEDETFYATELAEFLVFKGVAFTQAHAIVGKLVRYSEDKKIRIKDMPDKLTRVFHKELSEKAIKKIMNPEHAVSSKKSVSRKSPGNK